MISTHWIAKRKPHWQQIEDLLKLVDGKSVSRLTRAELRQFSLLYRQVAADLSVLRADPSGQVYARYLNSLLGRAHNIIYTGGGVNSLGLVRFFTQTWPAVFRKHLPYVLTSTMVFLFAGLLGVLLTLHDPAFQLQVLGPHMVQTIEHHEMWTHSIVSVKPLASSSIMTNNLSVSFMTFAMGITAGLGTLWMLFFNGLLMGVIGTACWLNGMSVPLWSFVAPHGALELPAIFIAGAGGLRIAHGVLFPGHHGRRDSLRLAGKDAVQLLLGIIPMLVIAGLLEGFVSPTGLSPALKFAIGGVLFTMLLVYLSLPQPQLAEPRDGS
jgi:uncharacterized membrane protein SpoIIM required for sporulation